MITARAFLRCWPTVGTLHRIVLKPFGILFLLLPDTGHSLQVAFASESLIHGFPSRAPLGMGKVP